MKGWNGRKKSHKGIGEVPMKGKVGQGRRMSAKVIYRQKQGKVKDG